MARAYGFRNGLDNDHMSMVASGALFEGKLHDSFTLITVIIGLSVGRRRLRHHAQELTAAGQLLLAIAVAEETVVPDAPKALRRDMEQEPANELFGGEGHRAETIAVAVVFPAKANFAVVDGEQTIVGYGDAMGIAADIVEDLFGSGERRLGVNDPFSAERF